MADGQTQVPEPANEVADHLAAVAVRTHQYQEIEVRLGVKFGAPVAAYGKQCQVGGIRKDILPDFGAAAIHESGAVVDERCHVVTAPESLGERLVEPVDAPLDRLRVQRQSTVRSFPRGVRLWSAAAARCNPAPTATTEHRHNVAGAYLARSPTASQYSPRTSMCCCGDFNPSP